MASSSGTLRFADKVSLEEFPEGQENENARKTTEHNIALLKKFLMLKGESRVFRRNSSDEFIIHQRMRKQRFKIIRSVHCIVSLCDCQNWNSNNLYSICREKSRLHHYTRLRVWKITNGLLVKTKTDMKKLVKVNKWCYKVSALIRGVLFSISISSFNQSLKLAVQESSPKKYKRFKVLDSDSD